MREHDQLAQEFEAQRPHLRAVAYRMLGSLTEAEDAVQDAWLRASLADSSEVGNLRGWLTTIVARVCLNLLRSRRVRREESFDLQLPDPVIRSEEPQPEDEALRSESVGLAMLVVLDTLAPAERLAFVLHDMFDLPFEEIAPLVDRNTAAARQLASRARRRVKDADLPAPDGDMARQRDAVDAFFRAARGGDFDALVAVLDPDIVLRTDFGVRRPPALAPVVRGAETVARQALMFANPNARLIPAVVNGAAGVVVTIGGRPFAVMGFTVRGGKIVEINAISDGERVGRLAGSVLGSV